MATNQEDTDDKRQAYVTLATNDAYCVGALVLGYSLRNVNTTKTLVCMISIDVSTNMRRALARVFDQICLVNVFDSKDSANLSLLDRRDLGVTFTKLHCWRLTQYKKCVFLDADTLVLQNCDELFEREELSAAPDPGWPDCFNSGVFVYCPNQNTYDKLLEFAKSEGSFDGGDQGLLNLYFNDWSYTDINKHLPFLYNVVSQAFYSYLPAFKRYGAGTKICHFIGAVKPWHHQYDESTGSAIPDTSTGFNNEFLQKWWQIFRGSVLPLLSQQSVFETNSKWSGDCYHTVCVPQKEDYSKMNKNNMDLDISCDSVRESDPVTDSSISLTCSQPSHLPEDNQPLYCKPHPPEDTVNLNDNAVDLRETDHQHDSSIVTVADQSQSPTSQTQPPTIQSHPLTSQSQPPTNQSQSPPNPSQPPTSQSQLTISDDRTAADQINIPLTTQEIYNLCSEWKVPYMNPQCSFNSILSHIQSQIDCTQRQLKSSSMFPSNTTVNYVLQDADSTSSNKDGDNILVHEKALIPQLSAVTLGPSSGGRIPPEVSDADHQALWEKGVVDYTGIDSFENIKKHLDTKLSEKPPDIPADVKPKTVMSSQPSVSTPRPKAEQKQPKRSALKKPKV